MTRRIKKSLLILYITQTIESSPSHVTDDRPIKTLVAALVSVQSLMKTQTSHMNSMKVLKLLYRTLSILPSTLKEGCYINRSLLTLSTVIRKLRYNIFSLILLWTTDACLKVSIKCCLSNHKKNIGNRGNHAT